MYVDSEHFSFGLYQLDRWKISSKSQHYKNLLFRENIHSASETTSEENLSLHFPCGIHKTRGTRLQFCGRPTVPAYRPSLSAATVGFAFFKIARCICLKSKSQLCSSAYLKREFPQAFGWSTKIRRYIDELIFKRTVRVMKAEGGENFSAYIPIFLVKNKFVMPKNFATLLRKNKFKKYRAR